MYEARGDFLWSQTGLIVSMQYNRTRTEKERAAKPSDFNPFAKGHRTNATIGGKAAWSVFENLCRDNKIKAQICQPKAK